MQTQMSRIQELNVGFESTFLQRRYANGQQAYERLFNIISHQGNANKTLNENHVTHTKMTRIIKKKFI